MKSKLMFLITLIIIFSAGLFLSYKLYKKYQDTVKEQILAEKRKAGWLRLDRALKNKVSNFKGAVGLVVEDLATGREIVFNQNALIPSASLVKVPIMLSCFYAAQDGKISLKDTITFKGSERVSGSKVLGKEPAGSIFTVEELFEPMITRSDNAAANILINYVGFDTFNSYFKKMGLKNTNISRKMMDFVERKEGVENYTTAQDMSYLLEELYYKRFLNKDISEKCLKILGQQKINDRIPKKLPKNGIFIAHKTGLERHICHDIGIVFTNKGDFVICVLVKHENKFAQPAKKLISNIALLVYDYYQTLGSTNDGGSYGKFKVIR